MSRSFPDLPVFLLTAFLVGGPVLAAPPPSSGYLATALAALELGLIQTAEEGFRAVWKDAAARKGSDGETAGFNLGLLRERAGDKEGAAEFYRAVVEAYPGGLVALAAKARLGLVLASLGRNDEAVPLLEGVKQEDVGSDLAREAAISLAAARMALTEAQGAAEGSDAILKEAEASGKRGEALAYLILAREKLRQWERIVPLVGDPGMESLPGPLRGPVLLALGDAFAAGGDGAAAALWYRRAAESSADKVVKSRGVVGALAALLSRDRATGTASNAGAGSEILGLVSEADVPPGYLAAFLAVKGRFLWSYGRADEGRALLRRSAAVCTGTEECVEAVLALISLTGRDGDWVRASGEAEAWLAVGGRGRSDPRVLWAAADAAFRGGLRQRAEGLARGLLAEKEPYPSRGAVTVLLARTLAAEGREPEAVALLEGIDPAALPKEDGSAYLQEIVALRLRAADYQGVLAAWDAAATAGIPTTPQVRLARGIALQALGKSAEAEAVLKAEAEMGDAETKPEASFLLGYLLAVKGKKQEAVTTYKRVADGYPQSPRVGESLLMLASLTGELGQPKQSSEWASKAVDRLAGADRARALYLLALAEDGRKRPKDSVAALNRLLKEHPGIHPWTELAEMALGVDAERREDYSGAIAHYKKVVADAESGDLRTQAKDRIKLLTPYLKSAPGKKKQ